MPKPSNSFSGGSGRKRAAPRRRASGGGGAGRLVLAALAGGALTLLAIPVYFYFGDPPVSVTDKPALWEHLTERTSLERRMARENLRAPFAAGEDAFEGAARTYRSQCAQCHGSPAQDAITGTSMVPRAPQFFTRDRRATAARSAGQLYWATAFGIRRSGMPAYRRLLTNTQLWQLAVLLHSADQDLPDPVRELLNPYIPATAPTSTLPEPARPPRPPAHRSE